MLDYVRTLLIFGTQVAAKDEDGLCVAKLHDEPMMPLCCT